MQANASESLLISAQKLNRIVDPLKKIVNVLRVMKKVLMSYNTSF